jgi:hypothetical protein
MLVHLTPPKFTAAKLAVPKSHGRHAATAAIDIASIRYILQYISQSGAGLQRAQPCNEHVTTDCCGLKLSAPDDLQHESI